MARVLVRFLTDPARTCPSGDAAHPDEREMIERMGGKN